jgi:hypothetical protein
VRDADQAPCTPVRHAIQRPPGRDLRITSPPDPCTPTHPPPTPYAPPPESHHDDNHSMRELVHATTSRTEDVRSALRASGAIGPSHRINTNRDRYATTSCVERLLLPSRYDSSLVPCRPGIVAFSRVAVFFSVSRRQCSPFPRLWEFVDYVGRDVFNSDLYPCAAGGGYPLPFAKSSFVLWLSPDIVDISMNAEFHQSKDPRYISKIVTQTLRVPSYAIEQYRPLVESERCHGPRRPRGGGLCRSP